MACCSEFQTECLKVVTIGYLNSFIGSNIKDTDGTVKTAAGDSTYCPTYGELTGGSLIPNWREGSSPYLDIDGIVITGSYASNQLVRQKDLQVKYTTFNKLSIARSGSGDLSACGANETLTYDYKFIRHSKSMNSSCVVNETTTTVNGACNELSYHTTYGSVTNCTSYHIDKNGEFSGPNNRVPTSPARRCDTIYANVTFRGEVKKSNEISICQKKLTGYWSSRDSRDFVNFTVEGHPQNGGTIYSCSMVRVYLTGTATYTDWYHWIDECGYNYNIKSGVTTTEGCDSKYCNVSGPSSVNCSGTSQFSFSSGASSVECESYWLGYNWDCCNGRKTETKTLSHTLGGKTGSVTWTWICNDCDSCENCPQNHTCADCANSSSSYWGCSKCAKELGCDKCLDYLTCDDCPEQKSCDECPDLEKCQETPGA